MDRKREFREEYIKEMKFRIKPHSQAFDILYQKNKSHMRVVGHTRNTSTQKLRREHHDFKSNLSYIVSPVSKTKTATTKRVRLCPCSKSPK
jgi:hypothetical protein